MYLDIPFYANVLTLQELRQKQIDKRLLRVNQRRKQHDYKIGDQVLIKNQLDSASKLKPTYSGPYSVTKVHTNGTVSVLLQPDVEERYNIRRVRPARLPQQQVAAP